MRKDYMSPNWTSIANIAFSGLRESLQDSVPLWCSLSGTLGPPRPKYSCLGNIVTSYRTPILKRLMPMLFSLYRLLRRMFNNESLPVSDRDVMHMFSLQVHPVDMRPLSKLFAGSTCMFEIRRFLRNFIGHGIWLVRPSAMFGGWCVIIILQNVRSYITQNHLPILYLCRAAESVYQHWYVM